MKKPRRAKASNKSKPKLMDRLLFPVVVSYHAIKKAAKKTKEAIPEIYDQIESLFRTHIVFFEKKDKEKKAGINSLSDAVAANILRKLPTLDSDKIASMLSEKSSKSFLDLLTKGFGAESEQEKDYTTLGKRKLFKRILIANRGEIALRIMRACRELNIEVAVIYSDNDKDSLTVKFADKSYSIGSASNYLNIKKILDIAKKAGVDAIHPGYGFLAENKEFATLCEKKHIKFIGPTPKTIEILGDKVKAKQTVIAANVPVIEGTQHEVHNVEEAITHAKEIGYPIMLKASAGGGGKGMRIVDNEETLAKSFESAQREAKSAFGDERMYIEKYFQDAKHVEFQMLADDYGNIIHLGERDCSIQRRHQKLIEEAPSITLDSETRKKMGDAAIRALAAAKYNGAGTVEFLVDKNNNFYFLEVNTRIQVEHGITEMVTSVDLVKEQIKIAAGAKLTVTQDDVKFDGHAIECRINEEDPFADFAPSPGKIINYLPPGGPGIRICSSCHAGHEISPHYDSLITKLIVKGKNREEAIARMKRALEEYIIEGVKTTIPFHLAVL